jgi:hypothetical protein
MLNDTILTTAWLIQEDRHRKAMQELLIAEAVHQVGMTTLVRVRVGAVLVHIGGRLMTTRQATPPWRTVQVAR